MRFERLQKPVVGVDVHRAQERVRPRIYAQRRVRRPTLAEEEQRRTIGLDGPDLRVEPADLNLTGSVGDRDDAVGGAEIHADCNRNHSKTASSRLMRMSFTVARLRVRSGSHVLKHLRAFAGLSLCFPLAYGAGAGQSCLRPLGRAKRGLVELPDLAIS